MSDLLRDEMERCARCGQCRTVCPVFAETNVEMMVARGRISLAQAALEGRAAYSRRMEEYIQSCLKCLRCAANCPSGVQYERILQEIRFAMARDLGVPLLARAIFRLVLPNRFLFDLGIRMARLGQGLLPVKRRGQMRHLPLFFAGRRWIPRLARKSALRRLADHSDPNRASRPRIALFLGCLINYVYPEIAESCVNVLERMGFAVVVPKGQLCCGTPVLSFGDESAARNLAERNVEGFLAHEPEHIVAACASCGKTLKSDYEKLAGSRGAALARKVVDISELAALRAPHDAKRLKETVTYHDPCHLRWGQNVIAQPRELLRRCCEYVEMEEAETCCGGGGTFSLFHYDMAARIAGRKAEAIAASGADIVATNCPGCILHISDRLTSAGIRKPVVHTIQILEKALRMGEGRGLS